MKINSTHLLPLPRLNDWYDKDLPESVRHGQRLTTMTSGQARFPIAPSKFKFEQAGQCGMWVTELLPWTKKVVDDMTFVRSMYTEAMPPIMRSLADPISSKMKCTMGTVPPL